MKNLSLHVGIIGMMSIFAACDTPKSAESVSEPAKVQKSAESSAKKEAKPAEKIAKKEAKAVAKKDEIPAEKTPPKKVEVKAIPFKSKDFPAKVPPGELLGGFAFHDSAGDNYVIFARQDGASDGDHITGGVLRIKHVLKKGDTVTDVRAYTERIENCEFDTILEPAFGDWSVSDVDQNGVGEASFAYTADCVSDVSPNAHKAFVTEGGEKYVLRGVTSIKPPGEQPFGGEYKADKMPAAFLKKAEAVWIKTSRNSWYD